MADERTTKTGQLIYTFDLKDNGGKCPYCGETVWETESSK